MANWKMVAIDMGTGVVAGGLDSFIQDKTNKQVAEWEAKPANAGKELSLMSQYTTYYNYGLPLLTLGLVAFNKLPGDWVTRMAVASGGVLGRKVGQQLIDYEKKTSVPWRAYGGEAALAAAQAANAAQAAAGRANRNLVGSRGSL
ncbi:MAG: hypothetical protein V1767_00905 [Chloroflexota bacterium]